MKPLSFLIAVVALFVSPRAQAACPGVFAGQECDGDSSATLTPICSTSGAVSQVVCDLGYNGETAPPEANFVQPTHTTFRAYGFDGNGDKFCCELAVSDGCTGQPITTTVYGTTDIDNILLTDGLADQDMTCGFSYVYGDDSGDTIVGSRATTNVDLLFGEAGDDVIHALAGNDMLYGGDNEDILFGDDGIDYVYGEDDWDRMDGGNGADWMYGDDGTGTGPDGKNAMRGGPGVDHMYGGPYTDGICGDQDLDVIYGNGGDDDIYGGVAAGDAIDGGGDYDECEEGTCEGIISSCAVFF